LDVKFQVDKKGIRKTGLEELVIAALWLSREEPEVYFGEINGKKVLFVALWRTDSKILKREQIIRSTAIEVYFSLVEDYRKFVVYIPHERKVEYLDDLKTLSVPGVSITIPVVKAFGRREITVLKTIEQFLMK
jgi:hypothetical protein